MLPTLALGHVIPFFELSKRIASKGHRVSFLSSPGIIRRLPPTPPIHLVELPLPPVDGLPSDAEVTIDLPSQHLRPHLRKAFDGLESSLIRFLEDAKSTPVDWIIFDYSAYWVPRVAARLGIPCAYLGLFSAAVLAFYGPPEALMGGARARTSPEHLTTPPEWVPFPSSIAYRGFEARELFKPGMEKDISGVSEAERFGLSIGGCDFAAVRSCPELEAHWLDLLRQLYGKPVVPIGLLPPALTQEEHDACHQRGDLFEWLDEREPGSVVYTAFGSETKLSYAELREIAQGLEGSGLPFLWALRRPSDTQDGRGAELDELLRRGSGRGLVCEEWVPQARILAHRAVGGFLTHGGWNSVVEGLSLGRALVLLPLMFDQGLNARDLVERGIGVEVPRDEDDGSFTADGISEALRLIMVSPEGLRYRNSVRDCRAVFGDEQLHDGYVGGLLQHLQEQRSRLPSAMAVRKE